MTCLSTLTTNTVNNCIEQLTIGTIADTNTTVEVWLMNLANGRIERFLAVSDGAGLVKIDLTATFGFELLPNSTYSIRILIDDEPKNITIGSYESYVILMPVTIINGMVSGDVTLTAQ